MEIQRERERGREREVEMERESATREEKCSDGARRELRTC